MDMLRVMMKEKGGGKDVWEGGGGVDYEIVGEWRE